MSATVFKSENVRFTWKVVVVPHRLTEPEKCKYCNGTGKADGYNPFNGDDLRCQHCSHGFKLWLEPMCEQEIVDYLQEQLNNYIKEKGYPSLGLPKSFANE
jgi:hypothetical protein